MFDSAEGQGFQVIQLRPGNQGRFHRHHLITVPAIFGSAAAVGAMKAVLALILAVGFTRRCAAQSILAYKEKVSESRIIVPLGWEMMGDRWSSQDYPLVN